MSFRSPNRQKESRYTSLQSECPIAAAEVDQCYLAHRLSTSPLFFPRSKSQNLKRYHFRFQGGWLPIPQEPSHRSFNPLERLLSFSTILQASSGAERVVSLDNPSGKQGIHDIRTREGHFHGRSRRGPEREIRSPRLEGELRDRTRWRRRLSKPLAG